MCRISPDYLKNFDLIVPELHGNIKSVWFCLECEWCEMNIIISPQKNRLYNYVLIMIPWVPPCKIKYVHLYVIGIHFSMFLLLTCISQHWFILLHHWKRSWLWLEETVTRDNTIHVYSVTVMTHVKALEDGQSSQGASEPITSARYMMTKNLYIPW